MLLYAAQFLITLILIPILDYVWIGLLMKNFYLTELGTLARQENGVFSPQLGAAFGVYAAIALGVVVLVLPRAGTDLKLAFLYGAALGFSIYGTYDLTNLSILQNWSVKMTVVDIAWGTFLCGTIGLCVAWITPHLPAWN